MSKFESSPYIDHEPEPNLQGCGCIVIPLTLLSVKLAELKKSIKQIRFRSQEDVLRQAEDYINSIE